MSRMYKVWVWNKELDVPNASLWRNPWGFYLRTRHVRLSGGPLFGGLPKVDLIK